MEIKNLRQKWHVLKPVQTAALQEVLQMQHKAVQLVAMAGEYLVPSDEHRVLLNYSPQKKIYYSDIIEGDAQYRVGLNILDLTLEILTGDLQLVEMYDLNEKTLSEGYYFMERQLFELGIDVSSMKMQMPFNLPSGPAGMEKGFKITKIDTLNETLKYRANAIIFLEHFKEVFGDQSTDIKTWPRSFDTSVQVRILKNEGGDQRILEIGFTINDALVEVPYFYVRLKSGMALKFPEKMPLIRYGYWNIEKSHGAIFKINNVYDLKADKQPEVVAEFFNTAISILMDIEPAS